MVGAALAGADEKDIELMEKAGLNIGMAFQIRMIYSMLQAQPQSLESRCTVTKKMTRLHMYRFMVSKRLTVM